MQKHTELNGINPIGMLKRFGALGPVYKVLEAEEENDEHDSMLMINVVDSGETLRYPYSKFLEDPKA